MNVHSCTQEKGKIERNLELDIVLGSNGLWQRIAWGSRITEAQVLKGHGFSRAA